MKSEDLRSSASKSKIAGIASELIQKYGLPPNTAVELAEVDEELCWEEAYKDFESGSVRLGLRAKLFTQFNGDALKVKVEFIKVRAQELIELRTQQATESVQNQLRAALALRQEQERIDQERRSKELIETLSAEDIEFLARTRDECRPLLTRLQARSYEVLSETMLPNEQSWSVRSKTNGMTFRLESIEDLRKLVF